MDSELQAFLRKKYRKLIGAPPRTPIFDRGIEVRNGWLDLLVEVFAEIEETAADNGTAVLVLVKEKFGLLRIHAVQPLPEGVQAVLCRAEAATADICETCGQPGALVNQPGPLRVRCKRCD